MSESPLSSNDLRNTISSHGVDRELVDLVGDVADQSPVVVTSSGTPVTLAAAADAAAAAYLRRHSISIALDSADAERLNARHGWRLEPAGKGTSYVQVNSDDLLRPGLQALVADTLATAFARSMAGPRDRPPPAPSRPARQRSATAPAPKKRVTASAPQRGQVCEIHFIERSVDGTCPMCED